MDVREQSIAESNGFQANKYGLVLCKVLQAFGPYSKDDAAGFPPSQVANLQKQGLVEISDPVDPDSTLDEAATADAEASRRFAASARGMSEEAYRRSLAASTGFGSHAPIPQVLTVDTGPDPRVREFHRNAEIEGIPEGRRRPIREIEQQPNARPLAPAGASLSEKPMAVTAVTGAPGEPLSDPKGVTDLNDGDSVHIPDGIEEAHGDTRKELASQIAGRKVSTQKEADQIIADEKQKRAGSAS